MESIEEQKELLGAFMDLLEQQFGPNCEVVLHDLTRDYNQTIVDIRNGHLTGRKVGGSGTNLGLEVLRGSTAEGNRFNYVLHTPDGKIFRSSSIYFRNSEGEAIGSLCVNLDITDTVRMENFLKSYNQYDLNQSQESVQEVFVEDVSQILDYLLSEGVALIGHQPSEMTRDDRIAFLRFLDQKGAFLISKSGEKVCEFLGISKFTLYNSLDAIRNNSASGKQKD